MEKRKVVGYEDLYEVDNHGNVYSLRSWRGMIGKKLIPQENSFGYLRIHLTKNSKTKGITLHKIVTRAFIGEMPVNQQVRHLDGNKKNNDIKNLCYGSSLENSNDRNFHNKTVFGEKVGTSKLSNNEIQEIRNSSLNQKELAKKYNVSIANISMILNFKSRKNG